MEYTELEKIIKEEYLKLTNVELTDTSYGYNEKMAHGGMSSGQIDGRFWMTKGLPLLKSRLIQIKYFSCLLMFLFKKKS